MSVTILDIWLAILLAGLFCWIASALIHMVIKYHNADMKKLSNEEAVASALNESKHPPGLYHMPFCSDMSDMGKPEVQEKFNNGPIAVITIFANGLPPMGKLLLQQLFYFILVSVFVGYIASMSNPVGTEYMTIFRHVFVMTFAANGLGVIPFSIWYGHPWSNCLRFLIDALIYAAVTAGTFAWLWPSMI